MQGRHAPPVVLSPEEREEVERIIARHSTPQQLAQRGRMILAAADGESNSAIARRLQVNNDTVSRWCQRWLGLQAATVDDLTISERLEDCPRAGRPAQITAAQTCQILALACEQPHERPISQWTGRELADEVVQRGILPHISPRHVKRLLKKGRSDRT